MYNERLTSLSLAHLDELQRQDPATAAKLLEELEHRGHDEAISLGGLTVERFSSISALL